MASVPDILGLTHIAVSSVVQLVLAIRQQVKYFRLLPVLLELAEERSRRIRESVISLESLAQITSLDSEFFSRTFEDIQEVEQDLNSIQEDLQKNSATVTFFSSSKLADRLNDVANNLQGIDQSLNTIGLMAEVVSKKIRIEHSGIEKRIDRRIDALNELLNRVLSSNRASDEAISILQVARSSDFNPSNLWMTRRPTHDLLAAEQNSQLYFLLGRSYYTGDNEGGKDYYRAARFLISAYVQGSKRASYFLGKLYYDGLGVEQCFETAFNYYTDGAENGDCNAMHEVGWCLEFGLGTERNGLEAVKYFNMSAERGSSAGMRSAAYHALHGNVSRQNWPKAVRLLHKARQEGILLANFDLADCYEHGIGVDRDPRMASRLLQEVYESGQVMSGAFHLARCYELGIGVEQDWEKAASLYRELKTQGTWEGKLLQVYYGMCLIRGHGVTKNIRAGLKSIQAGLKTGHGCGWAVYGDCYRHGYGVEKDVIKAVRCYYKAIAAISGARGIADAHFALAEMYETGDGLAQDVKKAARHYIQAADRMNRVAQWKAGTFFESGTGVESQVYRAFYYFDLSARSGFVLGQRKAGELYMKGTGVSRDRTKAISLLEEAVQNGDAEAKKVLLRVRLSTLFSFWKR